MTDLEAIGVLLQAKSGRRDYKAFDKGVEAITKITRIKEITARALRSSDPINLYKALCLNEIAEILGVKAEDPAPDNEDKDQITFDDII